MKKIIKGFALFLSTLFLFSCSQQSSYQGKSEFSFKLPTAEMLKNVREATIDELSVDGSSEGEIGDEADEFSTFDDFTFHVYLFKEPDMVDRDKEKQSKDEQESYIMEGSFREEEIADSPDVELIEESEDYSFDLEQYFAEMKIEYSFYEYIGEKTGSAGESITFNSLNEGWYKIVLLGESKDYPYEFFQGFGGGEVIVGEESQVQITVEHWFICDACGWVYDQEWGAKECSNPDCPENCKEEETREITINLIKDEDTSISFRKITALSSLIYCAYIPFDETDLNNINLYDDINLSFNGYASDDVSSVYAKLVNISSDAWENEYLNVLKELVSFNNGYSIKGVSFDKGLNTVYFPSMQVTNKTNLACILYYFDISGTSSDSGITLSGKEIKVEEEPIETKTLEENITGVKDEKFTLFNRGSQNSYVANIDISDVLEANPISQGDTIVFTLKGSLKNSSGADATIPSLFYCLASSSDENPSDYSNQFNVQLSGNINIKLPINFATKAQVECTILQLFFETSSEVDYYLESGYELSIIKYQAEDKVLEFSKKLENGKYSDYVNISLSTPPDFNNFKIAEIHTVSYGDKIKVTIEGDFPDSNWQLYWADNSENCNYWLPLAEDSNNIKYIQDENAYILTAKQASNDNEYNQGYDDGRILLQICRPADDLYSSYTVKNFSITVEKVQ